MEHGSDGSSKPESSPNGHQWNPYRRAISCRGRIYPCTSDESSSSSDPSSIFRWIREHLISNLTGPIGPLRSGRNSDICGTNGSIQLIQLPGFYGILVFDLLYEFIHLKGRPLVCSRR